MQHKNSSSLELFKAMATSKFEPPHLHRSTYSTHADPLLNNLDLLAQFLTESDNADGGDAKASSEPGNNSGNTQSSSSVGSCMSYYS
jgi:hypothetical protein